MVPHAVLHIWMLDFVRSALSWSGFFRSSMHALWDRPLVEVKSADLVKHQLHSCATSASDLRSLEDLLGDIMSLPLPPTPPPELMGIVSMNDGACTDKPCLHDEGTTRCLTELYLDILRDSRPLRSHALSVAPDLTPSSRASVDIRSDTHT